MPDKTIKVSELVHSELERRKEEGDSFDDVLRDMMGLTPDLDDMVAYFDDELQQTAKEFVKHIDEQGEFDWKIREADSDELRFRSSGTTVAVASFTEDQIYIRYRGRDGDMTNLTRIKMKDGEVQVRGGVWYDKEKGFEYIEDKIPGAYRRWG